jgi:MFS transporter, FSR family, fosmidomycin resistance protein
VLHLFLYEFKSVGLITLEREDFMIEQSEKDFSSCKAGLFRGAFPLVLVFLTIEFFDELAFGTQSVSLPLLHVDLGISYAQIGLLLGLPAVVSTFIEPVIMLFGDTLWRKNLVIAGGLCLAVALFSIAAATSFPTLLIAFMLAFPASGAFVSLSQATLVDISPGREPQMMARWTLAGSIGSLVAPMVLVAGYALNLGWRPIFSILAIVALILVLSSWLCPFPEIKSKISSPAVGLRLTVRELCTNFQQAVKNLHLLRWIFLIQISDLLLDVFSSYLPLYLSHQVGLNTIQTSLVMAGFILSGLVADALTITLLNRFSGPMIVRRSAMVVVVLYPWWLISPWTVAKIGLLFVIRLATLGWYSVMKGEAYASHPGKSGAVVAISSLAGLFGGGVSWVIGWFAGWFGLSSAMYLLWIGPLCLFLFIPRQPVIPNTSNEH